jgi:hypothetical protein
MATKLDELLKRLQAKRRAAIEARANELAALKNLRQATAKTIGP